MTQYIFITGGVVSSLGKGLCTAALGAILEARGLSISFLKFDPYINVDPGTMSPMQHGEVYVTQEGTETDLDLGHYERFSKANTVHCANLTAGAIYADVIQKERRGEYLGATIQIIPHITNEVKHRIIKHAANTDIAFVEIGGTVGDIESLPLLEAIRQMRMDLGSNNTLFIHLTLVPYLATAGEIKTKPTQHSVKELRSIGIQPDVLICRSTLPLPESEREKISLFSNVPLSCVISAIDLESIYQIPQVLHDQQLDTIIIEKLGLNTKKNLLANPDLSDWQKIVDHQKHPKQTITVAMVGKYVNLADAYKSLNEALAHAGIHTLTKVIIHYVDPDVLEKQGVELLKHCDAILIPGGFGERGLEGVILAARYARENNIPYLGICLGMQVAIIEFARHKANMAKANSTEFDKTSPYPVVALISEWISPTGVLEQRTENSNMGGTMRLGAQPCYLNQGSKASLIYGNDIIYERHRHRYEVNNQFIDALIEKGLTVSGWSKGRTLVEMIEIDSHPWFIACQFHPEFTSKPRTGHPLFINFVQAALTYKKGQEKNESI